MRNYELMCNNNQIFTNDELWNFINTDSIKLSDVIHRAYNNGISGDFIMLVCREGNIWGSDLYIQACREFALQHTDEKLESDPLERTKLARQQSLEIASYDFYENMRIFMHIFYENKTSMPQLHIDKKTLYIGSIVLNVPSPILDRYKKDKKLSGVKYTVWKTVLGKSERLVNPKWYRMFEKTIMNHLTIFLDNMNNRIQNFLPIHTAEYCRLYSLINGVLPYISTESLVCLTKRDYTEMCIWL